MSKVTEFGQELILLEEFKNCLPDRIVIYLKGQKVLSLAEATVMADEFAVTHKSIFVQPARRETPFTDSRKPRSPKASRHYSPATGEARALLLLSRARSPYFHLPIP